MEGLKSDGVADYVTETSGLPLESYFSTSKLAWIIKSLPEAKRLLDQGKLRLGTTDAFFLDRLSGSFSTDITTASRTSLMNLETGIAPSKPAAPWRANEKRGSSWCTSQLDAAGTSAPPTTCGARQIGQSSLLS